MNKSICSNSFVVVKLRLIFILIYLSLPAYANDKTFTFIVGGTINANHGASMQDTEIAFNILFNEFLSEAKDINKRISAIVSAYGFE